METFLKDPDSTVDFAVNWSNWLDVDTIATSVWLTPDGITKDTDTNSTTLTTIWLSGGVLGKLYTITNRITTAAGRTADKSFKVKMVNK